MLRNFLNILSLRGALFTPFFYPRPTVSSLYEIPKPHQEEEKITPCPEVVIDIIDVEEATQG